MKSVATLTNQWQQELSAALSAARQAAHAIRPDFGKRSVTARKGRYDIQLRADLVAQRTIIQHFSHHYPEHGIVSEEGMQDTWELNRMTWVVDPLDGTNNFGYGIAHCAVAITLFDAETPVLSVVFDPVVNREFMAVAGPARRVSAPFSTAVGEATVALVTDYSEEGRVTGRRIEEVLSQNCKRVTTMWAPALDLALVSTGALDAMVSRNASLLDVCAGIFLVQKAGGCVLGLDGAPLRLEKSLHHAPVSFVAAGSKELARKLLGLSFPGSGW
ncbi:inositol monophosphatase family protein [Streptomyces sp. NPDC051554]|uniref:inositol monophosphatase family protein n=1 Tax=Streptomyces sp. NPDC051554 TaxID=3365656 RepID=UPI00379E430F